MTGIGLIGFGYWGPKLARTARAAGGRLVAVADLRADRLATAAAACPGASLWADWRDLLRLPEVEAVIVATPAATHFAIAQACLAAGRHVLVEKPMATDAGEAARLVELAAARRLTLMVDHTFLYSGGIVAIGQLLHDGALGRPHLYDGLRRGPRPAACDVDVLWDLACHDAAILDHLFGRAPETVAVTADAALEQADIALDLGQGLAARLRVGWGFATKQRRALIGGSRRIASYDEPSGILELHDHAAGCACAAELAAETLLACRRGAAWRPAVEVVEPLLAVGRDFLASIDSGHPPRSDGETGLRVVRTIAAAAASARLAGRPVRVRDLQPA